MLIIISQIVLLFIAVALPLKQKRDRLRNKQLAPPLKRNYKIDTDTRDAQYVINEFGSLEKINNQYPEVEN